MDTLKAEDTGNVTSRRLLFAGEETVAEHPGSFWFPKTWLLLTTYVDDTSKVVAIQDFNGERGVYERELKRNEFISEGQMPVTPEELEEKAQLSKHQFTAPNPYRQQFRPRYRSCNA